jgi:hypothetical protein
MALSPDQARETFSVEVPCDRPTFLFSKLEILFCSSFGDDPDATWHELQDCIDAKLI